MLGWILIVGGTEPEATTRLSRALEGFIGDYGTRKRIIAAHELAFGLRQPETPLPLLSWSFYQDSQHVCFIEGDFYDKYHVYEPKCGEDPYLAAILANRYAEDGARAIESLNGCFSGFLFECQSRTLTTFIDRLGVRVLYWTSEKDQLIVSSNLGPLRNLKRLKLDADAAFQFLTVGFPIGERTLLQNVRMQSPSTVNVFRDGSRTSSYYYAKPPKRRERVDTKETVASIAGAMGDFAHRINDKTAGNTLGLGLTGGHDSRVVLSALVSREVPIEIICWKENNFNDQVVQHLCSFAKLPLHVHSYSQREQVEFRETVFAYTEGHAVNDWGFAALGKQCSEHNLQYLLLGFAGDVVSGSLTVPEPESFKSIEDLAKCALRSQMELLSFETAKNLLVDAAPDVVDKTIAEWTASFQLQAWRGTLTDIAIWQRLANRNLKRIRNVMAPGFRFANLIFPYLDRNVLDSYLAASIRLIRKQRAHCYAGFYTFKEFGEYQATSFPIPLKWEARLPFVLYSLRLTRHRAAALRSAIRYRKREGPNPGAHEHAESICTSPLYDRNRARQLLSQGPVTADCINKLRCLVKAFDFYMAGEDNEPVAM
jgi:asparagine synthetase B (glutamine-hydrolysing)